jgi:hypothetical protein
MPDDPFRRFTCWTIPIVQKTLFGDIASLGLDADAVFLAAHTSLEVEQLKGVRKPGVEREVAVLRALDSSFGLPDENTLIAVTGPSGSGKSHLVRWVRAHLSDTDDAYHLVYVPKALETLRELLGHILDRMPIPEADAVKKELEKAVGQKPPEQLAEELLDRLRSVLGYELPDVRHRQDADTRRFLLGDNVSESGPMRREGGLSDLLLVKSVRDHLLRPDGAINRMVNSVRGQRGGDEETPDFKDSDLPVRQAGVASQLQGRLVPLWSLLRRDSSLAVALLNEARNRAVAEALGMRAGVNLGEVFAKTRRKLKAEGKELVLLFEDLAQFGLFDGDLYDHFQRQPGEDLAPIRALFAITDGKFAENVPPTVQTRLAYHFKVPELIGASGGPEDRVVGFTTRYLNVARVGRERLIRAWTEAPVNARESGSWIPNACLDTDGGGQECVNREECWGSFGSFQENGLYPYNRIALRREVQRRGDRVTARTVVDETIKEFLIEAHPPIELGSFPGEDVRARFDFSVGLPKESIVPEGELSTDERDRLHRCRVIWANGRVESAGIAVAFDLPASAGGVSAVESPTSPIVVAPDSKPRPLLPLVAWQNGEELLEGEAVWYRERLHELVSSRVDLASMLIDPGPGPGQVLLGRVMTPNSFEIKRAPGQPAGRNRLRFEITADDSGVLLLSAVRWWWDHGHWNVGSEQRMWDFPLDGPSAQLAFDEFVDAAVREAEGAIVGILGRGPCDPASAAVILRASAILSLGGGPDSDVPPSLEWVLATPSAQSVHPSTMWTSVAAEALATLNDIGGRWIGAFASARQGETGEPLCVDAARLIPAASAAAADPLGVLTPPPTFDDSFTEISVHWERLGAVLSSAIDGEANDLIAVIEGITDRVGEANWAELVGTVESAGRLAGDHNVFRPVHQYRAFGLACDRLGDTSDNDLARAIDAVPRLKKHDGSYAVREVMAAQRWAADTRSIAGDLELIQACLEATSGELRSRLAEGLVSGPEAVAKQVGAKVKELDAKLTKLGQEE